MASLAHMQAGSALRPSFRNGWPPRRAYVLTRSGNGNGASSKIGFIGLGKMGSKMLHNLVGAGHRVVIHDKNQYAVDRALALDEGKVEAVDSPAEMAAKDGVDILFTMLPHPANVEEVYLGKDGILEAAGGPMTTILVDCSTTDPVLTRKIAVAASRVRLNTKRRHQVKPQFANLQGIDYPVLVDAPVSGGVVGAEKGTLGFMVGGDKDVAEIVKPYLLQMGHSATYCGGQGNGMAARLVNTLVVSAVMAATSEGLALARRLGVEPEVMTEVLNNGSGQSWVSLVYNPVPGVTPGTPASAGYSGGFATDTVIEQLKMLIQASDVAHSPVPIAKQLAEELYHKVHKENMGDKDFTAVYRYYYGSGVTCEQWKGGDRHFNSMPM